MVAGTEHSFSSAEGFGTETTDIQETGKAVGMNDHDDHFP